MLQYIEEILLLYVNRQRGDLGDISMAALVLMDKFRGQVTDHVISLLEVNNIHVCFIPANTTDLLQPLDIAVNKPAKDFLKCKFEHWYSEQVMKQLQGVADIQSVQIQPINLCLAAVKELSAKWLAEMGEYLSDNPQFVVNGFRKAGILKALDGSTEAEDSEEEDSEEDNEEDLLSEDDCDTEDDVGGTFSSGSD